MPKRDPAYMEAQRTLLAKAALDCLVEKGIYETSIRDICLKAGLSIGAFYGHFADRQAAILAACALDYQERDIASIAPTWDAYVANFRNLPNALDDPWVRKRLRLSLQMVAEFSQLETSVRDIDDLYNVTHHAILECLDAIHRKGEISLPLGLERTAALHGRLVYGTIHVLLLNRELDRQSATEDLIAGLALTAGLTRSGDV